MLSLSHRKLYIIILLYIIIHQNSLLVSSFGSVGQFYWPRGQCEQRSKERLTVFSESVYFGICFIGQLHAHKQEVWLQFTLRQNIDTAVYCVTSACYMFLRFWFPVLFLLKQETLHGFPIQPKLPESLLDHSSWRNMFINLQCRRTQRQKISDSGNINEEGIIIF